MRDRRPKAQCRRVHCQSAANHHNPTQPGMWSQIFPIAIHHPGSQKLGKRGPTLKRKKIFWNVVTNFPYNFHFCPVFEWSHTDFKMSHCFSVGLMLELWMVHTDNCFFIPRQNFFILGTLPNGMIRVWKRPKCQILLMFPECCTTITTKTKNINTNEGHGRAGGTLPFIPQSSWV